MNTPDQKSEERDGIAANNASLGAVLNLLDRPVNPAALSAAAALAAQPAQLHSSATLGVLLFKLDEETLAVPARMLRRITPHARPSAIPHRSSGLLRGLCNIRGELVLCADLRHMLGMPPRKEADESAAAASDQRRMVVIGPADASWVFEVDAILGVERIDPAALRTPPLTVEHAIGAFVTGLTEIDSTAVTVLDGERILAGFKAALA